MKRKRGGQPGNQNARKHGFFSSDLDPGQIQEFWDIVKKERVAPEVALLRVKLASALKRDPDNRLVLNEAAKLTAKWSAAQHNLDRAECRELKQAILVFWEYLAESGSGQVDEKKLESSVL